MMYNYVDNFFRKTNASYVERYSDSSDFEYPTNIPPVTAKRGNHVLINSTGYYAIERKEPSHIETFNKNLQVQRDQLSKKHITKRFKKIMDNNQSREEISFDKHPKLYKDSHGNEYFKNRGDQSSRHHFDNISSKSLLRDKVLPRLSTIFRRSNYTKQAATAEEKQHIVTQDNDQKYCVNCERRRLKKLNKKRRYYGLQPNYAVVGNIHEAPIRFNQTVPDAPLSHNSMTRKQSNTRCCISSSGSDVVQDKTRNDNLHRNSKNRKDKKLQYEYQIHNYDDYFEAKRHKHLQYPSKHFKPYEVYAHTSCQAKNQSCNNSGPSSKIESSSSSFWEYVAERIKAKNKKPCSCEPPAPPKCNLDSCEILNSPRTSNEKPMPPKFRDTGETFSSPTKMKTNQVECKCNKTKSLNQDNQTPSCQEPHDALTQHLADKYKGHILCIHNPPCILINGCLNLPQPKIDGASNVWRLSQSKRNSYREENVKPDYTEDACQYQPPITLPECLPEFQTEKIVQSICNHDPPCEVVHGCFKPKFDAKLQNSCVHVPMCQKLPECVIKEGRPDVQSVGCSHSPKCDEVPLCSKKFVVLTARDNMSTQVKPKMKMVCRHEPQCLMIPKCIGRVICSETVPFDAIPDCVHHPCCEMIPACCRKAPKEMPSLTSNEEGISLKVPRIPLQQRNRLLRLIQAKRQF